MKQRRREIIEAHPCLHPAAARWFGRLHLAVAGECNIKCRYCSRRYDCANENRPGVTSRLLDPRQALERVKEVVAGDTRIRVVGIAGPGEPLANPATLQTFKLVHQTYPDLIECVSTNGLLLTEQLTELAEAGVRVVTVTVNAATAMIGRLIYEKIHYHGKVYTGEAGAELLLRAQLAGISEAASMGMVVKVNTVYIPGINDDTIGDIAVTVKEAGATLMNLMPLIPQADFAGLSRPSRETIQLARSGIAAVITQIGHCRQCRADAAGMLC